MDILIEVKGKTNAPNNAIYSFIDMIEENRWYFGGGSHDGAFRGMIYAYRDLTLEEVRNAVTHWFAEQGWSFEGTFGTMLETEDLILRRAEFADWKPMYENVWRHESAARYMNWDVTTSEEEARDRIRRTIRYQENGGLSFIVCDSTDTPIGFARVMEVSPGVYEDTGGCLGPDYQRKGYGGQILDALTGFVFSRGAEVFLVSHRRENLPSKKVITRQGFAYSHSETTDGRIVDFYEKRRRP